MTERDYGALCTAFDCGRIVRQGESDGTPFRHSWCKGKPSVHEAHAARQARRRREQEAGALARDAGMAAAAAAAPDWTELAKQAVRFLAATGTDFTIDDVIERAGLPNDSKSNANNAVGALMSGAAKRRIIERVGYTRTSRRLGHARSVAVWRGISHPQRKD